VEVKALSESYEITARAKADATHIIADAEAKAITLKAQANRNVCHRIEITGFLRNSCNPLPRIVLPEDMVLHTKLGVNSGHIIADAEAKAITLKAQANRTVRQIVMLVTWCCIQRLWCG
jgi:hypothetical protein